MKTLLLDNQVKLFTVKNRLRVVKNTERQKSLKIQINLEKVEKVEIQENLERVEKRENKKTNNYRKNER